MGLRRSRLSAWLVVMVALASVVISQGFQFVYVPCDSHSAMEEWNLIPKNKDDHIGCLTDRLQLWYAKAGGLTGEKRAHFLEHLKFQAKQKNLGEDAQEKLSGDDPFIDDLVSQESVEIVTLLPPMPESGYISVCMYVDDKGMARRLPINHRATSLMTTVTDRAGPVLGDVFLSRAYDNEEETFRRMDMMLCDVSSSAGWVRLCVEYKHSSYKNKGQVQEQLRALRDSKPMPITPDDEAKGKLQQAERDDIDVGVKDEENPITRDGHANFPAAHEPEIQTERECLKLAGEIKDAGNQAFTARDFSLAGRRYAKAKRYVDHTFHVRREADTVEQQEIVALRVTCNLNNALALIRDSKPLRAVEACDFVLSVEPSNSKALHRKGIALRDAGKVDQAKALFRRCIDAHPEDAQARAALKSCDAKEKDDRGASKAFASKMFAKGLTGDLYPAAPKVEEAPAADERFDDAKLRAFQKELDATPGGTNDGQDDEGAEVEEGEESEEGRDQQEDDDSLAEAAQRLRHEKAEMETVEREKLAHQGELEGVEVEEGPAVDRWDRLSHDPGDDDQGMDVSVGEEKTLDISDPPIADARMVDVGG